MKNPRIISGSAKGIRLEMVPGNITRPITDRVKEALFNIIGADIFGSTFLDLFGGTGNVGIEALSRGANKAVFIEISPVAKRIIEKNLEKTKLIDKGNVLRMDAFKYIQSCHDASFDYVFIAPPQYKGIWIKTLGFLDQYPDLSTTDGWLIVQIDPIEYSQQELINYSEIENRKYGSSLLIFFEKKY